MTSFSFAADVSLGSPNGCADLDSYAFSVTNLPSIRSAFAKLMTEAPTPLSPIFQAFSLLVAKESLKIKLILDT